MFFKESVYFIMFCRYFEIVCDNAFVILNFIFREQLFESSFFFMNYKEIADDVS